MEKIKKKKLPRWKGKHILLARRVTLVKSVLSAMSLFFLSIYTMPHVVKKEITAIQ